MDWNNLFANLVDVRIEWSWKFTNSSE
jgi:hypothetical protein